MQKSNHDTPVAWPIIPTFYIAWALIYVWFLSDLRKRNCNDFNYGNIRSWCCISLPTVKFWTLYLQGVCVSLKGGGALIQVPPQLFIYYIFITRMFSEFSLNFFTQVLQKYLSGIPNIYVLNPSYWPWLKTYFPKNNFESNPIKWKL